MIETTAIMISKDVISLRLILSPLYPIADLAVEIASVRKATRKKSRPIVRRRQSGHQPQSCREDGEKSVTHDVAKGPLLSIRSPVRPGGCQHLRSKPSTLESP